MKNYILIQNDGEIETNSFELIGASTKRNDNTKIGFFGSGLKYSIAYLMRNNIHFKIFSGKNEIVFTTKEENFREQTFNRICINGNPTSYTTTMGATWNDDWFILREIYCNALDEVNCQMVKCTNTITAIEGKTRFYLEATEKLTNVIANWDSYFTDERTPLYSIKNCYTSFLDNKISNQKIDIYNKTNGSIFRKGINVGNLKNCLYDYSFEELTINEDRTASKLSAIDYCFSDIMALFPSENYISSILRNVNCDEFKAIQCTNTNSKISSEWIKFSKQYLLVVYEKSGNYADEIANSKKEALLIPHYFAKQIKKEREDAIILGIGKSIGKNNIENIEITDKMKYLLNSVINDLNEMKYVVPYDIEIVKFDENIVLGQADIEQKKIYLSEKLFNMGKREIALTIIEEVEHINSGCSDETRAFQNHLISKLLTTMEDFNGLFL